MFQAPFSFDGRIRRTEYGITLIIHTVVLMFVNLIIASTTESRTGSGDGGAVVAVLIYIPLFWFFWAQGAKRCHDVGNSGWWQLIPLYGLWLLFEDGQAGPNQYGENPKAQPGGTTNYSQPPVQQTNSGNGYSGGYNGGHNNPGANNYSNTSGTNSGEYKQGDLYR